MAMATRGRSVSGRAVPTAASTLPTAPSDSPRVSPTHSMPLVKSSAASRIRTRETASSNQSTARGPWNGHRRSVPLPSAGMDARGFLDRLVADGENEASLAHVQLLEAREPVLEPLPDLPELLGRRLSLLGIEGLYPHQRRAIDALDRGDNVV